MNGKGFICPYREKKKERQRYAVIYCVVSHNRAENTAVFTEWYF